MMVVFVCPCVFHRGLSHYLVKKPSPGSIASIGLQASHRPFVRLAAGSCNRGTQCQCLPHSGTHSQIVNVDRSNLQGKPPTPPYIRQYYLYDSNHPLSSL